MAIKLNNPGPNTQGQQSDIITIVDEETYVVHGTISNWAGSVRVIGRKTGSAAPFEPIDEFDIREPGPVTVRANGCDIRFIVVATDSSIPEGDPVPGMEVSIEDGS